MAVLAGPSTPGDDAAGTPPADPMGGVDTGYGTGLPGANGAEQGRKQGQGCGAIEMMFNRVGFLPSGASGSYSGPRAQARRAKGGTDAGAASIYWRRWPDRLARGASACQVLDAGLAGSVGARQGRVFRCWQRRGLMARACSRRLSGVCVRSCLTGPQARAHGGLGPAAARPSRDAGRSGSGVALGVQSMSLTVRVDGAARARAVAAGVLHQL